VGALGLGGCARAKELTERIDPRSPGRLTFAAINDVHVLDARSTAIVGGAVQSINANPDIAFTVILGDIATDGELTELKLARHAFDRLEQPWFAVPGNHDVYMKAKDIYSNYRLAFGRIAWVEEDEGWVFMGIDTCEGAGSNVTVRREQLKWIEANLERIRPSRPIALFGHHPFNPHTKAYRVKNADEVLGLFSDHNLKLVAAGHYHGNQVERQDGILFTTTACCSTTRGNFDGTDARGYRLFHLDGETVETEFVEVST
jgi:3',5'-cyclic AMP phosphodiesterase CpdA